MSISTERKTSTLIFNPFVYIAGGQALALGLAAIFVAGLLGYFSDTHFDGVLDTHTGLAAPAAIFLAEGYVDWLCLSVVLLVIGKFASGTSFRVIDLFGTQALARWPTVFTVLLTQAPAYQRFIQNLVHQLVTKGAAAFTTPDAAMRLFLTPDTPIFLLVVILMLPPFVWLVLLMYNSYSVSCNLRGGKAIGTFIAGLLLAEILSKFAIIELFHALR